MAEAVAPIRPDEIAGAKKLYFPPEVLTAFNNEITKNYSSGYATVKQDDVVNAICESMNIGRQEVFARKYLDVEEVYRAAGWTVSYDKPAYNEDYPATFQFRKKRTSD